MRVDGVQTIRSNRARTATYGTRCAVSLPRVRHRNARDAAVEATDESTRKPGPVLSTCAPSGGNPSRPAVAGRLYRSTLRLGRAALDLLLDPAGFPVDPS